MARKQATENDVSDLELNMTPMIDVVFQLIIFLMLANDMSRKEIEDLVLPNAIHGTEDLGIDEKRRLIVNLQPNERDPNGPPIFKVRGEELTIDQFQQILAPEADREREDDSAKASSLFILVRADHKARWQDVQWVMQACADPKIRVYKLQFAVLNPTLQQK